MNLPDFLRLWAIVILAFVAQAGADEPARPRELSGTLYEIGSHQSKKMFTWKMSIEGHVWKSEYFDLDGALSVDDELTWKENGEFSGYRYNRHLTGEVAEVKLDGQKLHYTQDFHGKHKEDTEKFHAPFLTGPMAIPFVWEHWDEFISGHSVSIRYGVLDRQNSYSFDLERVTNHPDASEKLVVIRMRASNLFVRAATDPLFLVFSKDDKSFRKLIGRSLVVAKDGDNVVHLNAELVIDTFELTRPKNAPAPDLSKTHAKR